MTIKDPQLIKKMKSKARQSISKFKISAFGLNSKGEVVIKTTNSPRLNKYGGGCHAEAKIFKVATEKNIKTIIICRIGLKNNLLPIDPCASCKKTADKLGIKIISIN
jgi:cytidine deaminase